MLTKLLTFLISFFIFSSGLILLFKNRKFKKWPKTTAKILEKEVRKNDRAITSNPAFRFEPFARYSYTIAEKNYENTEIYPDNLRIYNSQEKIEKILDKLPEQTEIFYNPDNPSESFILLPNKSWAIAAVFIGAIMSLGSLTALLS